MSAEQQEHLASQTPFTSHSRSLSTGTSMDQEHQQQDEASLRMAETRSRHDANASVTSLEGGNVNLAEQTLVEEESSKKEHKSGLSTSSVSLSASKDAEATSLDREGGHAVSAHNATTTRPTTWDPLSKGEEEGDGTHVQDQTIIVEGGEDVVDSSGKLIFGEEEGEEGVSRRRSHLRLDLKGPSAMPWEEVEPPMDNNLKALAEYYSPATSHKYRTLHNSGGPRALIPKSSYYFGPPPPESAYGTAPVGQIGVHHPREILRVERDYSGGEVIQFAPIYPLELEGRITPTQFLETINAINELLISAHSLKHSFVDNTVAILSLQISRLFMKTHFEKEMKRLQRLMDSQNAEVYNRVGLNMLWPGRVGFLYMEIEYY